MEKYIDIDIFPPPPKLVTCLMYKRGDKIVCPDCHVMKFSDGYWAINKDKLHVILGWKTT